MRSDSGAPRAGWGLRLAAGGGLLFLNLPLLFILIYALTTDYRSFTFPPPGLTLRWFAVACGRPDVWHALLLSVEVALVELLEQVAAEGARMRDRRLVDAEPLQAPEGAPVRWHGPVEVAMHNTQQRIAKRCARRR